MAMTAVELAQMLDVSVPQVERALDKLKQKGLVTDLGEDWQLVSIWPEFNLEVDCNTGNYRRVYQDGRIELEDARISVRGNDEG
ncbi:MAG: winged helix-turn-helix transcriptional regulator [Aeromonas sp.]|uniref:Winged helix-turn-helix transcriptional regulator n=1 Tax=Escherichia coli TaxID=562 RepID=A0A3L0VYW6_ECOLX|nr:winged helix-turn-helix transcriptional regulator [Aeromonas caviae]MDH1848022.1 winged helix-turn-helix transcriptional regulator [Aeromonas caviae]MDU7313307.1 winged helix-turn-helix transcriptional regulator [Aeromonas sp.]MDX7853063.1 winged helix-turn-helix transcriptional regulator [Aeromonas caviae]